MKMKNTNFFQQHIEKLILGGALLVAGLIVLLYVLGSPYGAQINGREMGPTALESEVAKQAQQLSVRLQSPESPFPDREIPQYTQDFHRRVEGRIAPPRVRIVMNEPGLDPTHVEHGIRDDAWEVPTPPAPTETLAAGGIGMLGAFDDRRTADSFLQFASNTETPDIRYVSVAGTFDMAEWRERLERSSLPSQFYRGIADFIAGVYLLREELKPGGDPNNEADWINRTVVNPLPTQVGFLPSSQQELTQQQADQTLQFIKENQQRVAQPAFPPLANNAIWQPPDARVLTQEDHDRLKDLREEIQRLEGLIERYHERQERMRQIEERRADRPERPQRPRFEPDPMGFDEMGPGGPGGPGVRQPRVRPQVNRGDEQAARYQSWMADLQQARLEFQELTGAPAADAQQAQQMFNPDAMYGPEAGLYGPEAGMYGPDAGMYGGPGAYGPGYPGEFGPGYHPGQPRGAAQDPDAPKPGTIKVWAHDLTVEPGKTYRYKLMVAGINPLFRQRRAPEKQVQENFNKIALGPDPSEGEWTNIVRVHPERYFFMLNGSQQTATVEVWRVYSGRWVRDEYTLQPGDPIGGTTRVETEAGEEVVDMSYDAVVVDLIESSGSGMLGGRDNRLLYLQPGSQEILARSAAQDADSPVRVQLQNERALQEQQMQIARQAAR